MSIAVETSAEIVGECLLPISTCDQINTLPKDSFNASLNILVPVASMRALIPTVAYARSEAKRILSQCDAVVNLRYTASLASKIYCRPPVKLSFVTTTCFGFEARNGNWG